MSDINESNSLHDGLAIIGMAGRFPKAKNPEELWSHLCNGSPLISIFSDEELIQEGIDIQSINHPSYVKAKGMIEDIDCFDAELFGYSPKEAACMDPQQRILLECAWEALERSGYDPEQYSGSIGVFAGSSLSSYFLLNIFPLLHYAKQKNQDEMMMVMGNEKDFLTSRISYKLNLKGPSKVIQTACSTSLVAVSDACQALLTYQCDMALAGGVSVTVPQRSGYFYEKESIYSPDGLCRPFDAQAIGTVGGNGAGIVVLKRFEDAIVDGDNILGVIRGFAVNNDGRDKVGYTAPSVDGQSKVIAASQFFADTHPETIGYIEAHGTGTVLGDPIEIAALSRAFRLQTNKKQYCAVGSVKSNIGHLDAAAGIAGLIKTVLCLMHKKIPPTLNFHLPNPKIDFANSPFFINNELLKWENGGSPLRAGVSSFGIGGTNAHIIIEESPVQQSNHSKDTDFLLPFSANSNEILMKLLENFCADIFKSKFSIADIAYTLQVGRKTLNYRVYFIVSTKEEAFDSIKKYLAQEKNIKKDVVESSRRRYWDELGSKWMRGEQIEWSSHHVDKRNRVPLPTYPFAKTRFWVTPEMQTKKSASVSSPTFQITGQQRKNPKQLPESKIEQILLEIWEKTMQVSDICVEDNYFHLGGDSLMAIEIAAEIRKRLHIDLSIQHFFEHTTIRSLAHLAKEILINNIDQLTEEQADFVLTQIQD